MKSTPPSLYFVRMKCVAVDSTPSIGARRFATNIAISDMVAACVRAGRSAEQRVAEHIRARGLRPAENGLGGGGAGIVVRPDVSRMSRADRAELAARAERGERVKLSL